MPTFRHIRRVIAAVLLVVHLPACYHYVTPRRMTPREYVAVKHPKQVRVTLTDSTRVVLRDPWVTPDSLGGREARQVQGSGLWVVAWSGVARLEGHEYDNWAVAGVLGGVLVVLGGLFAVTAIIALGQQ